MGGVPVGMIEELVRQRQAEVAAAAAGRRPPSSRRPPVRRRVLQASGRLLVAAGQRLAGPDGLSTTRPISA